MNEKILVVDDEYTIRFTLERFLTNEGYDVSAASNYVEAIQLINSIPFDLIITDILLDERSGIDLLKEVRSKYLNCPVVMITGSPDVGTAREAVRLGAFDYIPKPVTKDAILRVTSLALTHKAINDEKEKYRINFENVFKNIDYGIVTVDRTGLVTDFNDAAAQMCGYSVKDKGKTVGCVSVLCNAECINMLKESLEKKKRVELYRHECVHQNSPVRVVTITSSPLLDSSGELSGAMMVIRDETRIDSLERDLQERKQFHRIIGKSSKMQRVFSLIQTLSDVHTTVLITGESGTGKELAVEALHMKGNRKDKPLIKVNCSALQENLLESELFGYVKGAFTGATEKKEGRFFKADGGTIFLDEIGDISPNIQLKLLRVIQEREFERVGDSTPIKIDVRIVTATNKDLRAKILNNEFREDLYYRLKVMELTMPPLRDNREDIPVLVDHFIALFNKRLNRHIEAVSAEVMQTFMKYPWPGNVRELEHAMEHAFIICNNLTITLDHLPEDIKSFVEEEIVHNDKKRNHDAARMTEALRRSKWNITKASESLGISRPTFYKRMRKFNIYEN